MTFHLGSRSLRNLDGVHPDLRKVVDRYLEVGQIDITIIDGLRTVAEAEENLRKGVSTTKHSRHLTGHAIDVAAFVRGKVMIDWTFQVKIAEGMKRAARDVGVPIEWGGDWRSFRDALHFQLPWKQYPISVNS